jgi:hypothetical protein
MCVVLAVRTGLRNETCKHRINAEALDPDALLA